ncbi:MAG: efflux RND transporter permease subunit, partial [Pseudomonadota bacterium]|nr:efflux RND transporter permease subunit [Pseudomonadota bacterium]
MKALIDAAIGRSRTVISTLVLILIAGSIAFVEIPKEMAPDVKVPYIFVSMNHEGISPEDAVRLLVHPMESELAAIEGLKEMSAVAYQGGAEVILEFEAGFEADEALQDVKDAVDDTKHDLPNETAEPGVREIDLSQFPVLLVSLSGPVPERTLVQAANNLKEKIEGIDNVLEVKLGGDREDLVEIIIDPLQIESCGLSACEMIGLFARSNKLVAAGNLDTGLGRFAIKVPGVFENAADVLNMPIKVSGDAMVRVLDVAKVRRTFKDPESFARVGGQRAVTLEIIKRSGGNIVKTVEQVRELVEDQAKFLPQGVEVSFSQDNAIYIRDMLTDLKNNVTSAILLVMIVCVGALGLRSALLVGIAVPGSFLAGILFLNAIGLSMNVVVLFSLILSVGMLVDGAVVVTEFADRKMSEGFSRREAYARASKRMFWPITASTATTLAAFLPLLFWPGIMGEFMKYMPITLLATLTASLTMAMIFVPTLGSVFGKAGTTDPATRRNLIIAENGDLNEMHGFAGAYVRFLRRVLHMPGRALILAALVLVGVYAAYGQFGKGVVFFPDQEPDRASVSVHARGNLSIWEKDALVGEVEAIAMKMDGIEHVYTRVGAGSGGYEASEDVIGTVTVEFSDWDTRRKATLILNDIREAADALPGILIDTKIDDGGPPTGKPVHIELSGDDSVKLAAAVATVRAIVGIVPGVVDVEDSRPLPGIEWELDVDRAQAAKFGLDLTSVGDAVQMVTNGLKVASYRQEGADDEVDIVLRYPDQFRSIEQLHRIRIETMAGSIPISNFVTVRPQPQVGAIERVDRKRVMSVTSEVAEGTLPYHVLQKLRGILTPEDVEPRFRLADKSPLDAGIGVRFRGEDEEQA